MQIHGRPSPPPLLRRPHYKLYETFVFGGKFQVTLRSAQPPWYVCTCSGSGTDIQRDAKEKI